MEPLILCGGGDSGSGYGLPWRPIEVSGEDSQVLENWDRLGFLIFVHGLGFGKGAFGLFLLGQLDLV